MPAGSSALTKVLPSSAREGLVGIQSYRGAAVDDLLKALHQLDILCQVETDFHFDRPIACLEQLREFGLHGFLVLGVQQTHQGHRGIRGQREQLAAGQHFERGPESGRGKRKFDPKLRDKLPRPIARRGEGGGESPRNLPTFLDGFVGVAGQDRGLAETRLAVAIGDFRDNGVEILHRPEYHAVRHPQRQAQSVYRDRFDRAHAAVP